MICRDLYLFSNTRSIRNYLRNHSTQFATLPKLLPIGEFLKKVLLFEGKRYIQSLEKEWLLYQATRFVKFSQLQFANDSLLIDSIDHLRSFIDEIALEKIDKQRLLEEDFYEDYHLHIQTLFEYIQRYKTLLETYNLIDTSNIKQYAILNTNYIKNFDSITLFLDGTINAFELDIYKQIAQYTPFTLSFETTPYSTPTVEKLSNSSLNVKYIKTHHKPPPLEVGVTQERVEQIGFVKHKIEEFISCGIEPHNIVIILPDENFKHFLLHFDDVNNLNFAMGSELQQTHFVQSLLYLYELLTHSTPTYIQPKTLLTQTIEFFLDNQKTPIDLHLWTKLVNACEYLIQGEKEQELIIEAFEQTLSLFALEQNFSLERLLYYYIQELSCLKIDDTDGGKVSVMGILETRGIHFDGVIVVDFNEGMIPKQNPKDLFLPDFLRKTVGLPTSNTRQMLQKNYYYKLFSHAKRVALSYVDDGLNIPSKFLDSFKIDSIINTQGFFQPYLFQIHQSKSYRDKEFESLYDFTAQPLSSTKLKTYLECQKKFYLQYIAQIKEIEQKNAGIAKNIGVLLHSSLRKSYESSKKVDAKSLQNSLYEQLDIQSKNLSHKEIFELSLWKKRLEDFFRLEQKRFEDGFEPLFFEKKLQCKFGDFILEGTIDRIDTKEQKLYVLDYKTGSKEQTVIKKDMHSITDFQLIFYGLLADQIPSYSFEQSAYYNLKDATIHSMEKDIFEKQKEHFASILETLPRNKTLFDATHNQKICHFCPYVNICNK